MLASPSGAPRLTGPDPKSNALARAVSRQVCVKELRALQELAFKKANDEKLADKWRISYMNTYKELREQIRVEKGWIKPGSRNVSVREEMPLRTRRKVEILSRSRDYLADADAVLNAAVPIPMPMPDAEPEPSEPQPSA